MTQDNNAQTNLDAVNLGIKSFQEYSAQLTEFDKNTKAAFEGLGQSHRDQNYVKFSQYFTAFWSKVDVFKKEVDAFEHYLEVEKKYLEEYIQKGNVSSI